MTTITHQLRRVLTVVGLLFVSMQAARAFPPAPYYTIFGTVRDESGQVLAEEGARVILLKGNDIVLQTPVTGTVIMDQNYELRIPIDMLRPSTTLYRESAVVARSGYLIAIEFNGQRFYPVGTAGSLTSGGGGERERFDFSMGDDSDNDGLPDAWEEWQLISCNIPPGPAGYDLTLLTAAGDLDKDGVSDRDEYIQGTYACDGGSSMIIEFKENTPLITRFEFGVVAGRLYRLQRSTNLVTWSAVPMSVGQPGFPSEAFLASDTLNVSAWVIPGPEQRVFYRLIIQ